MEFMLQSDDEYPPVTGNDTDLSLYFTYINHTDLCKSTIQIFCWPLHNNEHRQLT